MVGLDVLGEEQDADAGMQGGICFAATPFVVCVGGMRMSRTAASGRSGHDLQKGAASPTWATTSTTGFGEQLDQPGAQQRVVVSYHDTHGSSTTTVVPAPCGLSIDSEPPAAATRSAIPARPVRRSATRRRCRRR